MAQTPTTQYYLVAFFTTVDGGKTWQLNLSSAGTWTPTGGWAGINNPQSLVEQFKPLQQTGAQVIVSFGGAVFSPGNSITADTVNQLGQAVAYSLLGGTQEPEQNSPYTGWQRVFSDWHFDGIDLDLETSAGPATIPTSIWVSFAQAVKKYAPQSKLTGAPQSPYLYNTAVNSPFGVPFPEGIDDTCGNLSQPQAGDFLLSTTNIHLFDALLFQFYNQGGANEFPTEPNFPHRLCQAAALVATVATSDRPKIYVGVAAPGEGENGEPPGVYDATEIGNAIKQAIAQVKAPAANTWFGGVMGWESPKVDSLVSDTLGVCGGAGALYGFQDGNPGWK